MNLLLLANSHGAAVIAAYAAEPERWPGVILHPRALPAPHVGLVRLTAEPEGWHITSPRREVRDWMVRLWAQGAEHVVRPDAVAIIGASRDRGVAAMAEQLRAPDFPSVVAWMDAGCPTTVDPGFQITTPAALDLAAQAVADRSLTADLLRAVVEAAPSGLPVAVAGAPAMAEKLLATPDADPRARAVLRGDGAAVAALADAAHAAVLGDIADSAGLSLREIKQPAETLTPGGQTAVPFLNDSVHLRERSAGRRYDGHANAAYGALLLDAIVAGLK